MRGSDGDFDDAVVLVTGAASGIGAAVARAVAESGGHSVLLDRDGAGAEREAEMLRPRGLDALAIPTDVTDEKSVAAAVRTAAERFGGIDVVVTCAGISGPVGDQLEQVALAAWQDVFAVNVTGAFLTLKHALPALRASDRGAAVLLASDSAFVAAPGMTPYCASKAAVVQLARALSVEAAGAVRVNALCPSVVDTPMSRNDLGREEVGRSADRRCARDPGDFGGDGVDVADFPAHRADAIARHVLFLASPLAAGISGTSLMADFGYAAKSAFPA